MLTWWRAQTPTGRKASKLYGSIVAAARRAPFYAEYGVSDTPEGRFAMIVVHMIPVLEWFRTESPAGEQLARALNEAFVTDMDDYLREIGVGDLSVPRHVKKAAGALYECTQACRAALESPGNERLQEVLKQTLLPGSTSAVPPVAAYLKKATAVVAAQSPERILTGEVTFPDP